MQMLIYSFVWFIDRLRQLAGLVIPIFSEAADFRAWKLWVKVLVHCIIMAVILYGLYVLNRQPFVQQYLLLRAPDFLKQIYLPVLFLLVYFLSWLAFFWWKLLSKDDTAEYEDIALAWGEAVRKLDQAGINLGDAPLFVVIGSPSAGDDALFLASQVKIEVRAPNSVDSPLRIFAGRDGIFVTSTGASTWGKYCQALANPENFASIAGGGDGGVDSGKTINVGDALGFVDEKDKEEFSYLLRLQSERPLTPDEQSRLQELGERINKQSRAVVRRVSLPADDLAAGPKRLAYLCSLIKQDRRPWCPINGVMVLVPWASLDSDEVTRESIPILAGDLAMARKTLQLRYPHLVMVCDLEDAYGFDEFRRGFPKDMLKQRIGQRLPLVPDRAPAEVPAVMAQAADWIRQSVMPSWVIKFLRLDWPPEMRKTTAFVPTHNRKLFQFLQEIYVRGPRIGRLLSRGLPSNPEATVTVDPADALPLCSGCYLAATGRDEKKQAFVAGVFQRLTESQSSVSWSDSAVEEDRSFRRWSNVIFTIIVLVAVFSAYGIYKYITDTSGNVAGR